MGMDIHIKILKLNRKENVWEKVELYRKEGNDFHLIKPYPFKNRKLFDILNDDSNYDYRIPAASIQETALSADVVDELYSYKKDYCFGFKEINLADFKLFLAQNISTKDDEDYDYWDTIQKFINKIENYITLAVEFPYDLIFSDFKILLWFDY